MAACVRTGSAGITGTSQVHDPELSEGVDLRLEMWPRRAACRADRTRAEAGPRPVRREIVGRRPQDGDVDPLQLGRVFRVGR